MCEYLVRIGWSFQELSWVAYKWKKKKKYNKITDGAELNMRPFGHIKKDEGKE